MMLTIRIDLQDRIRCLGSNPHQNDEQLIHSKRQVLASMLVKAKKLQDITEVIPIASGAEPFEENKGEFDDISESASASGASEPHKNTQSWDVTGIACTLLILPSNGNVNEAVEVEICHQIQQAHRQINWLHDIIADISFQYLHVIQDSIWKSVRSNAQKCVKALHNDLVLHARIIAVAEANWSL